MAETTRIPTEMEARMLLRETARRAEDEAAIDAYIAARWRPRPWQALLFLLAIPAGLGLAYLEDRGQPIEIWTMLICLGAILFLQGIQIARLERVTRALARIAERAIGAEPPRTPTSST
jgi:hypothetical protein